jgi:hypothetical protein
MSTTLRAAVELYLRAKTMSCSTRNEYFSTLRKWERWGDGPPIEQLQHKQIREFLDWVHERALAQDGMNPGRTANKAREHLRAVISWAWEQELIDTLPRFPKPRERGITYRHDAHRAPLAFKAIMTIPQPSAFLALIHGHDGECPCCRRPFADAG